ncbi:MAG: exodeoxyribonuclease V subunit gamma, partial [Desulfobacteraceae bacterium]|nr:exodeoxyribonuclease V subunit gamma [Desulfobacteraceae bacterium]
HAEKMFSNILPYDDIEGSETLILGELQEFTSQLFSIVESMSIKRTIPDWTEILQKIIELFFVENSEFEQEMQVIRQTLNDLETNQSNAEFNNKVDLKVIKHYLERAFEKDGFGFGFITGGVTFCSMLPMRSIPAKVVCLIGLNNDAFPRQTRAVGFDLMAKNPRKGDRSRRNDDRYLFLESILSARDRLYISYVGQNVQDNSLIPPSVIVNELLDYIEQGFYLPDGNIKNHIITKHRLQVFSPEYFKQSEKIFSFSKENLEAAKHVLLDKTTPTPFFEKELPEADPEFKTINLSNFCDFFLNPAKFLLNKRLGIYLEEKEGSVEDQEAFELDRLDRYILEQKLVDKRLADQNLSHYLQVAKASGQLPHGTLGECLYDDIAQKVDQFSEKTRPFIDKTALLPLEIDFKISDYHLTGRISNIYPERLVHFRYAKIRAKDLLRIWFEHILLNAVQQENYPNCSLLIGLDPKKNIWTGYSFSHIDNSKEILKDLLQIYWDGLKRPIHFSPESSCTYVNAILKEKKSSQSALMKASDNWLGSDFIFGELENPYNHLCFKYANPLDENFEKLALDVFEPLIDCFGEEKV